MAPNPLHFAMLSHPGRVRKGNQDVCAADPALGAFVVCDGMGGAAAGEVASRMAADAFLRTLALADESAARTSTARMEAAIHAANEDVFNHARSSPALLGMGTTLVAVLHTPEGLTLAHVGDSRAYLFRDGILTALTEDHSLVEEQVRAGGLTRTQAEQHPLRNVITRAIGSHAEVTPDVEVMQPAPGDLLLLASDGLTRELSDNTLATLLASAGSDLEPLCATLVREANEAGGSDNVTVLLLRLP